MKMEYRQHASMDVLPHSDYFKHVSAMTKEELHSKAEIAEELAVRDMRIKELEAKLAAMTQERNALKEKQDNFCMQYRMDCDEESKELEIKLLASQAYSQQLREALEICKREMQGDKWDALYIDGVLASK